MKTIQFSKVNTILVWVSVGITVLGVLGIILLGGFNYGIDFEAGLSQRVKFSSPTPVDQIRASLDDIAQGAGAEIQSIGAAEENEFIIRVSDSGLIPEFEDAVSDEISAALQQRFGQGSAELLERSYVGPKFSQDLTSQAIWLVVGAMGLILIYLWVRFRVGYAVAALVTLVHDVVLMLVFIGITQMEITSVTIAAVLTIVGYSLNDTIVVFDRIRENEGLMSGAKLVTIIDTSITQSLSRTIMTSLTTLVAVLAIFIFTTGSIKDFALSVMVGIVVGTYSSIFIASPFYKWMVDRLAAGAKRRENKVARPVVPAKKRAK